MSKQYRIKEEHWTHEFKEGQIVTELPQESEEFQFGLNIAKGFGIGDLYKESTIAAEAEDGKVQLLEKTFVEPI